MSRVLEGLEPKKVFEYFEEICAIPHGSGNTKKISDYLVAFASVRSLKYRQDEMGNVIIWKAGTAGYEESAPVIMQGHMDMVCEKESDVEFDFDNQGLELLLNDNIITANGTTLGGDDGIAVAFMLALLDSDDIPHPPVEMVFTVDEEVGLLGASGLDCSDIKGRILLNLDSEEEGYLLAGCAGGMTSVATLPVVRSESTCKEPKYFRLSIGGLQGGHSGTEIDKGRASANQIMGRLLYTINSSYPGIRLIEVNGGQKDNAIPRTCEAFLLVDAGVVSDMAAKLEMLVKDMQVKLRNEYRVTDKDITLYIEETDLASVKYAPIDEADTRKVISLLLNFPGGIQRMSFDIQGLVETSLNMGILSTTENSVSFSFSVRSSVESQKDALADKIKDLIEMYGGTYSYFGAYPGWEYKPESKLRDVMTEVFEKRYGYSPRVETIHAGLECGVFSQKLQGLDCMSYGPNMKDIHTPSESMEVDSVRRTWEYTLEVLKCLK